MTDTCWNYSQVTFFYAIYKPHSETSHVLSINKILYMCAKCYNPLRLDYKSSSLLVTIASFQLIGSKITTQPRHSPFEVVKVHSKLILWARSLELEYSYPMILAGIDLNFDTQYNIFRKNIQYVTPIVLETVPILVAMSPLNVSGMFGAIGWMPKIRILKSFDSPFMMWMTEHFEFIKCSPLRYKEGPENTYFNAFDNLTWVLICLSVLVLATVARLIILCSKNPISKVSHLF